MMRLPPVPGEWIDRTQPINFEFEGKPYQGLAGDVISSALLACGVKVLGRSFKYHRPRGVLSLANADVNAMMQQGALLNLRADVTAVQEGMRLHAVNTVGGVTRDRRRFLDLLSPVLPVGFYYKAFHSKRWFLTWERMFRRFTGLGEVMADTPRITTAKRYDFCDVLVIGGGPSGLSAALAAAKAGCKVALVDDGPRLGGSGLFNLGGNEANRLAAMELVERVAEQANIKVYANTYAAGYYADHWVPLVEAGRITKMRARVVIFACGAIEQPTVFRNNDLPGVMLASAAQRLIYRYAIAPGKRAVILAANRDAYQAALDLRKHDIEVVGIVDLRSKQECIGDAALVQNQDIDVYADSAVYEALATRGELSAVRIGALQKDAELGSKGHTLPCDLLLMGTGWAPTLNLLYQAGARMQFDAHLSQFVPMQLPEGIFACGRSNGIYGFNSRYLDGQRAGLQAAEYLGIHVTDVPSVPRDSARQSHPYPVFKHPRGKNFVDFDEDLQLKDFEDAAQEGFDNIELMKRFTTVGMGPSQGKHSNMNAMRILARLRGVHVGEIGSTTARPMFHPVPMAHLAGRAFTPERSTPLHAQHIALGAKFMLAGQWQRPEYYACVGTTREQAICEEVQTVRNAVGLIDVSTLGKIELRGADAGAFLERVYGGRYAAMKIGSIRYGLMIDESGVIIDDGVIARLGEQHYYFTTTTSGAAMVYRELQRLAALWQSQVMLVNLTGMCGAINLAGPLSRKVLAPLCDASLDESEFPYLAVRTALVAGVPAKLLRGGFVGELGYEIHVPADGLAHVWDALYQAGSSMGLRAFGVEAQRVLRLEKGHLIVGQDTDGLTNPMEADAAWAMAMDKPFFVGQRSLRIVTARPSQQRLRGFRLKDSSGPRPLESHLVIAQGDIVGRVTSVAWSPTLQQVIGLALLPPDLPEHAEFAIRLSDGQMIAAVVTALPFYDPGNARQREVAA